MPPLPAPIESIIHVVSESAVVQTLFVEEATTSFAISLGDCWGLLFGSMRPQKRPATDRSGGDRATHGRGMARNHTCQHWRSRSADDALNFGFRPSEVATSVRSGGRGGSASQEAITSAKARSSSSGSASTTARKSNLAVTSNPVVTMTGHTETGWRSSAVAEITWEFPAGDTAVCSSVDTMILRGLARSATGIVSRSTPLL